MTRHTPARHSTEPLKQAIILTSPLILSILSSYAYATNNLFQAAILLILLIGATIIRKKHTNAVSAEQTYIISRLEDTFIFSGLSVNPLIPRPFGFLSLAIIVLLPHIAQQAQSLKAQNTQIIENKQETLPRTSILLLLAFSTLATDYMKDILSYTLAIIAATAIYTSVKSLKDTASRKKDQP